MRPVDPEQPGELPAMLPWAAALAKERTDNNTEMLRATERFRRRDLGHLDVEVTFDDPGTFTKPWKTTGIADLAVNVEVEEYICNENNQDVEHLVGK